MNSGTTGDPGVDPKGDAIVYDVSLITDDDIYLFNEGNHFRLHEKLGSHPATRDGLNGTHFAVWAPNANQVAVIGNFNGWNHHSHPLKPRGSSGIWEGFIPGVGKGECYKYWVSSRYQGFAAEKADPFALYGEIPPSTASIVWDLDYQWHDDNWLMGRAQQTALVETPWSIYEVHLGSWMRDPEDNWRSLSYRELADKLVDYVSRTGFTHVEFLPVMEHPFFGSWGYQVTGFFAPSSRFGPPEDFMFLVDKLHQAGIGVVLDWVPSHFPTDGHGLAYFDGTHLFEHQDMRQGYHPDWNSYIFNYGRNEVRSFLISNALFWLQVFHADGLRVDGVASMLYLDYSRKEGEWIPNEYGGRENIQAIELLRRFNQEAYQAGSGVQTIAEESTDWPMVSRPTYVGGLGFGMKWDMGWMHDTHVDPLFRKYHHNELTFRMMYAFTENFVLSLSHDEVVHGKGSLLGKMPGDEWQKFANLRLLYGYMFTQPGKKLLFMGGEFGQWSEWNHDGSLDWKLLDYPFHTGLLRWVEDLNRAYRSEGALHRKDFDPRGFEWIDCNDWENSMLSYIRRSELQEDTIVVICNFTPVPRYNYRVGVDFPGSWREILNSDATLYGGSGQGNLGAADATVVAAHGRRYSLNLTIPPLAVVAFKWEGEQQ
jgi:1,4-alpha-glucan branching enzyme